TVLAETGKFPGLLPGVEIDRFSDDHKGFLAATVMNRRAMSDSMTACSFATNAGWTSFRYLDILNAATGRSLTLDEFYTIGERINNLERCFNAREGLGRKDDTLPQRLLTDPIKTGPSKGHIVEDLDRLLDDYYQERGWDLGTGKPKKEKLDELGLGFAVDDIWP
ncbi:MAG: aldehyde ferredoxin oxidoreductase C-terminal domain-containing protein, partial [Chloroflexi bacterium]|nr:aldehyde ferredoxin oxidoreductase C-terminal domain-containing protein [Chloroflexota bacterium]